VLVLLGVALLVFRLPGRGHYQEDSISVVVQRLSENPVDMFVTKSISDGDDEASLVERPSSQLLSEEEERVDVLQLVGNSENDGQLVGVDSR